MTESVLGSIPLHIEVGCYGSFCVEVRRPEDRANDIYCAGLSLGSGSGEYAHFGHPTIAEALRKFADRLDEVFGEHQNRALMAWTSGQYTEAKFPNPADAWIRAFKKTP